jgi:hypothetical protein
LEEKAVELDLAMQFFQFDRDVDDEKVHFPLDINFTVYPACVPR